MKPEMTAESAGGRSQGQVRANAVNSQLDTIAESCAAWIARRHIVFVLLFTVCYICATLHYSTQKELWYDEIFTVELARLPSISDIWTALGSGLEMFPPVIHLLTRASHALFGETRLASRVPALLGYWVLCVCLFYFVARRCSLVYGAVAAVFPLVTGGYWFAYEARPYGIVLACCGTALLCWQAATERRRRRLALLGFALSLAVAVSSHYYALLLLAPFGLAEGVRLLKTRQTDWALWLSALAGLSPLLVFGRWLLNAYTTNSVDDVFTVSTHIVGFAYFTLLPVALYVLLLGLIVIAVSKKKVQSFRSDELAVAVGLVLLPLFLALVATFTKAYQARYVVSAVAGFTILVAFAAHRVAGGRPWLALCLLVGLVAFFPFHASNLKNTWDENWFSAEEPLQIGRRLLPAQGDEPIVVPDALSYLNLWRNCPKDLVQRLVFLTGWELDDPKSTDLVLFKRWAAINVSDFRAFLTTHPSFLIYDDIRRVTWILTIDRLLRDGAGMKTVAAANHMRVIRVSYPRNAPAKDGQLQHP